MTDLEARVAALEQQLAEKEEQITALQAAAAQPRAGSAAEFWKQQARAKKEQAFENSLEPLLRDWVREAPTACSAELQADQHVLLELEQRAIADTAAAMAEVEALAPEIMKRIQSTASGLSDLEQLRRLRAIVDAGNQLFFGMYNNILMQQVRNNDGYDEFCAALDAVAPDGTRFPQRVSSHPCRGFCAPSACPGALPR